MAGRIRCRRFLPPRVGDYGGGQRRGGGSLQMPRREESDCDAEEREGEGFSDWVEEFVAFWGFGDRREGKP